MGCHHDMTDVVQCLDATFASYQQRFFAVTHASCTVIAVVGLQCFDQIEHAEAAGGKTGRVRYYFKTADLPTQCVDIRDAGNGSQCGTYHPVQQVAFFH